MAGFNDYVYNPNSAYSVYLDKDKFNSLSGQNRGFLNSGADGQSAFAGMTLDQQTSLADMQNSNLSNGEGFGFNNSTLKAGGSVLSGLGSLAGAWAGLQGVKLGEKQLGVQQDQWNKNYDSQATTINNRIADQNAWKAAQGRTDLGSLVPKYNVG